MLLVILLARGAHGTTFVLMDEATLLRTSDVVLTATVTAIETAAAPGPDSPISTYIHLQPGRLIKGALDRSAPLILREPGGRFGDRQEWIYGAPEFWVGERTLLFLTRAPDGTLHTNNLSMGKFTLGVDAAGHTTAMRDFGHGAAILNPATGQLLETTPQSYRLLAFLERLRQLTRTTPHHHLSPRMLTPVPPELATATTEVQEAYTFLGSPSRWFEPDCGLPVSYLVDSTGDATLGLTVSRAAVDAALAAWTDVPTAGLVLQDGGLTSPSVFAGCGTNRVVFNDPSGEITDPSGCSGTLAIGGFCTSGGNPCNPPSSSVVNGTTFNRIVTGKVTMNNGWGSCALWTQCNMSEVLTHELGHTLGFGHSADTSATMAAIAHFDGRCASLQPDDVAAVTFAYPFVGTPPPTGTITPTSPPTSTPSRTPSGTPTNTPTVTQTPTLTPTRTPTASPTLTPTFTPTNSPTSTATQTPTRTPSNTPTITPTQTSTLTPSLTPTPTSTFTASQTRTITATSTPTRTSTSTPTRTPTLTPTQTSTRTASVPPTNTPTPTATTTPTIRVGISGLVSYYSNGAPVGGATLHATGLEPGVTQTDTSGQFAFADLPPGTWNLEPQKNGDFGVGVSLLDAVYVLQAVGGTRTLDAQQLLACDVTGNGAISPLDAVMILQYKAGLLSSFPVAQTCGSDWAFVPVAASAGNEALIQPQSGLSGCQPGAITLISLTTDASQQDFAAVLYGDCTGNWQPSTSTPLRVGQSFGASALRLGPPVTVRRSHALRVPLYVDAPDGFNALQVTVDYDATQIATVSAHRVGAARGALMAVNRSVPGRLSIALANATRVAHGRMLVLQFTPRAGLHSTPHMRISQASVDAL